MKKVLILQNKILHYRKPFFNELAKSYDITVLHSGKKSVLLSDNYKEKVVPVKQLYKIKLQKGVINEVKNKKYSAVIAMMDISWVKNIIASFIYPKSTRFAWWGIIVSENQWGNKIRGMLLRGIPTIFYTEAGVNKMIEYGFRGDKFTFCNNTFHIENRVPCHLENQKDSFLFVGSLDRRKNIQVLISAFKEAEAKIPSKIKLNIIGDGKDYQLAENLIRDYNLQKRVFLLGRINETEQLQSYYKKAIFSISYGQAGLGVLQSMGYGVPFMTNINAISGGEITNIKHNENGITCKESKDSLLEYLIKYGNDTDAAKILGQNAFEYYSKFCTTKHMAKKFIEVIES